MFRTLESLHFDVEISSDADADLTDHELNNLDYISRQMMETVREINEKLSDAGMRVVIVL